LNAGMHLDLESNERVHKSTPNVRLDSHSFDSTASRHVQGSSG
jgi:hypothetical protein